MSDLTDAELAAEVRDGGDHAAAFAELHRRHHAAVLRQARVLERDRAAAEDLVADAFADTLAALRRGAGPRESVRAYLMTAVRNGHADRLRANGRTVLPGDDAVLAAADAAGGAQGPGGDGEADLRLVLEAYETLPERWQAVLWHVVVEGERPRHVARVLGITANAVSQLTARAREGLCEAYLGAHVGRMPETCRSFGPRLGAYVRGTLGKRDTRALTAHLDLCPACTSVCAELVAANAHLRVLIPPAVFGLTASSYAAKALVAAGAGAVPAGALGGAVAAAGGLGGVYARLKAWVALVRRVPRGALAAGATATAVVMTAVVLGDGARVPQTPVASPGTRYAAEPAPPAGAAPEEGAPARETRTTRPETASGRPASPARPASAAPAPPGPPPPSAGAPPVTPPFTGPPETTPVTRPPVTGPPATRPPATRPPAPPPGPVAVDDLATVSPGGTVRVSLLANDTGDGLRVHGSPVAFGDRGTLHCRLGSGECRYRARPKAAPGDDVFAYVVTDRRGRVSHAYLRVRVQAG